MAWTKKFSSAFGIGTGMIVRGEPVIYYHDYLRFAKLVNNGTPTYFD